MSLFIGLPLKALWQSYDLFYTLAYTAPAAKWIIIQVRSVLCYTLAQCSSAGRAAC